MTVRTRVAPSPTGDPHVGTAYVALFNYCFARKHGGQFLLRIEDTDRARSTDASEQKILEALRWLGLEWNEGPDVGGPKGPYRQSERSEIYGEHSDRLIDAGEAFRCFCTAERLAEVRKQQMESGSDVLGYDGHCSNLDRADAERRAAAGESHVVRLRVPRDGTCVVHDLLRGAIEIDWSRVDMQVLLKSDGMPTYHLANVVDDHLMEITHVIRGEEWINSAPKHLRLYEAFGWDAPQLCHLPLLRNPDKSKLSKRKNPTSITYYERMGYLPEAMLNYLGRMAWSMPNEEEKFSLDEMVENFSLERISLGGPIFDVTKLSWLNGRWIREDLDDAALSQRIQNWALNADNLMPLLPLVRPRIERLSDLAELGWFFLAGLIDVSAEDLGSCKLEPDDIRRALTWGLWQLDALPNWDKDAISDALQGAAAMLDIKPRNFFEPFYMALTGRKSATPLFETASWLGRDLVRARLRSAVDVLGGISKKEDKRWKKEYESAVRALASSSAD